MQNPSKWLYSVYCSFPSGHATSIFHPLMSCNAKIALCVHTGGDVVDNYLAMPSTPWF